MKQIVVHCDPESTKVALLEDRQLVEFFMEKPENKHTVGNIYKGRVVNVLPGMQAAFVDIGLSRNAFLYIDDLLPANLERQPQSKPTISELIREGQELVVQVMKEPVGNKGAKVTTHFSLPGRWLVYMPIADYIGVSRKIASEEERLRLKTLGEQMRRPGEGLIFRTIAEGEGEEALLGDLRFLRDLWRDIAHKAETDSATACLYQELDVISRIVRDVFSHDVDECIMNNAAKGNEIKRLLAQISPELAAKVMIYTGDAPILEHYGISEQLEKTFKPKVWLRSGGYINIDHTEALTVVDVNTGKYTGTVDLQQTVLQTNLEAAEQIARLIRLKDIGGIIIIDFIDMETERHREMIVERMEGVIRSDRTKTLVVGWTKLGLLELTRKKVRNNRDMLFYETCPSCSGTGKIALVHM